MALEWITAGVFGILAKIFVRRKREEDRPSLAKTFSGARRICKEEGYELAIPPRQDRPNPFADEQQAPL